MKIRPIALEAEYSTLSEWWTKRRLQPPQQLILQGAQGFAVNAGIDIMMGWFYRSGNVGFVEWITSNPSVAASPTTADALVVLLDFMNTFAKGEGANVILCSSQDDGSVGRFISKLGWLPCGGRPHNFFVKAVT
jgi:hypothetical protein